MIPNLDRFTCRRCGLVFESRARPMLEAGERPEDPPTGRICGYTRAAPPCPNCGSLYCRWDSMPESLKESA